MTDCMSSLLAYTICVPRRVACYHKGDPSMKILGCTEALDENWSVGRLVSQRVVQANTSARMICLHGQVRRRGFS